jgi:Carbohydrate-binding family 9
MKRSLICPFIEYPKNLIQRFSTIPWNGDLLDVSNGCKPSLSTRFKCLWDKERVYFLIDSKDTDIRATMKEPNSKVWMEEAVEILLAPGSQDPYIYYELQLSPANVSRQVKVIYPLTASQNLSFDDSWHCYEIETKTYIQGYLNEPARKSTGWQAVFSIPFKCFGEQKKTIRADDVWRVNVFRIDRWPGELYAAWAPTFLNPPSIHSPKHFGYLNFKKT